VPLGPILATVAAYVVIALLLLSLNLTSRWKWWIKGGAILVTGVFFVLTYFSIAGLLGWPSEARPPDRFAVIATRVVEPNAFTGDPGAIYLWLEEIDDNNVIIGEPRNYALPYTEPLADAANGAQDLLDAGEEVAGEAREPEETEEATPAEGAPEVGAPGQGAGGGYVPIDFVLIFSDLPAVALPTKGAL
jgi:hypothetical protein